jgi:hypothetical protein
VLRKDGEFVADLLYDEAYLGDGEYIALSAAMGNGTRLTVLDSAGMQSIQQILWKDCILKKDFIMVLPA